jgi:predicted HTH domain antitoxin
MEANTINLTISETYTPYIYSMSDGQSVGDKANIFMVIGMFTTKTVSLEKAAELVGKSIWDFVEILKKYNIPWGEYTQDDQKLDDITIAKITGEVYGKN